jgi:hypothetical protein
MKMLGCFQHGYTLEWRTLRVRQINMRGMHHVAGHPSNIDLAGASARESSLAHE